MKTIFDLIVKNWKTTATALATAIVWLGDNFGLNIPLESKQAFTAFLVSLGFLFAKDGDKTHSDNG